MKAWLVNTNVGNNEECVEYMIRHNKVAAYYNPANSKIDRIEKDDLVLLYHNQSRIVAVGCVVKKFVPHVFQQCMNDIEHWADVNWIWKASFSEKNGIFNPLNPIIRTEELGIPQPLVRPTVSNITEHLNYKLLFEEISKKQTYM
ncbi:MAG: hypothetical protein WCL34_12005 [Methylococcaceae bacterium]